MYCKRDRLEVQQQRGDDWKLNIGKKINNHNLLWEKERKYQWIKVSLLFFQEMTLLSRFCYFRKRELLVGLQTEARDHRNLFLLLLFRGKIGWHFAGCILQICFCWCWYWCKYKFLFKHSCLFCLCFFVAQWQEVHFCFHREFHW